MRMIDEQYTARPFFGSRRMVVWLGQQGHAAPRVERGRKTGPSPQDAPVPDRVEFDRAAPAPRRAGATGRGGRAADGPPAPRDPRATPTTPRRLPGDDERRRSESRA